MGEKTLPPTPQRERQARLKGQLALSQDLVAVAKLALVGELCLASEGFWRDALLGALGAALQAVGSPAERWPAAAGALAGQAAGWGLVLVGAAAATAVLVSLLQTRLNIASQVWSTGWEKLDPARNLGQMFSLRQWLMTGIGLLKLALVLAVGAWAVQRALPDLLASAGRLTPPQAWSFGLLLLRSVFRELLGVLVLVAVLDWALQRAMHARGQRIDLETLRREHKEAEGDPQLRGQRKSLGRDMLAEAAVPAASAAVVNPEHLIVALAFDPRGDALPRVVGKARDATAVRWRESLAQQGVPVFRYVDLARRLYASAPAGGGIPRDCLRAVALVYAATRELAQKTTPHDPCEVHEFDPELAAQLLRRDGGGAM